MYRVVATYFGPSFEVGDPFVVQDGFETEEEAEDYASTEDWYDWLASDGDTRHHYEVEEYDGSA